MPRTPPTAPHGPNGPEQRPQQQMRPVPTPPTHAHTATPTPNTTPGPRPQATPDQPHPGTPRITAPCSPAHTPRGTHIPPSKKGRGDKQRGETERELRGGQRADTRGTPEPTGMMNAAPTASRCARRPPSAAAPTPHFPHPSRIHQANNCPRRNGAIDHQDKPPRITHDMQPRTPRTAQPHATHLLQPAAHPTETPHTHRRHETVPPLWRHASPATAATHSPQTRGHHGKHQSNTRKHPASAATRPPGPR